MFLSTFGWSPSVATVLGLVGGGLAAARVADDSNAIAARLQGPFLGMSLDALSLKAAEATRRLRKIGFRVIGRRAYAARAGF